MASARDETDSPKRKTVKVDFVNEVNGGTIEMSLSEGENPPEQIQVMDQSSGNVAVLQLVNGAYVDVGHHHCQNHPDHPPHSPNNQATHPGPCPIHHQDSAEQRDDRVSKQRQKLKKKLRDKQSSAGGQTCQCHCSCASDQLAAAQNTSPENRTSGKKTSKPQEKEKNIFESVKLPSPKVEALSTTSAKATWSDPLAGNEAAVSPTKYELQCGTKSSGYKAVYNGSEPDFTVDDLKPGTSYNFRYCAFHEGKKSSYSGIATCQTPCGAPCAPSAPHLANKNKTNWLIKWTAPVDNGRPVKEYLLEWDEGKPDEDSFTELYKGPQKQYKFTQTLPPGTKCRFRVMAANDIGPSEYSSPLECTSAAGSAPSCPSPPSLIKATATNITLSWSKPDCQGAELTEYSLEMEDESSGYGFLVQYRGLEEKFSIKDLKRFTSYKFRLSASNSQGTSKWSQVVTYSTIPEPPVKMHPPVLDGKPKTSSFTVSWNPPSDSGGSEITEYSLQMDDGEGGAFKEKFRGLGYEWCAEKLSPGHVYRLRIACISAGGISPCSDVLRVVTAPVAPSPPSSPQLSASHKLQPLSLHITWDPPGYTGGAPITHYLVEMAPEQSSDFAEVYNNSESFCFITGLQPGRSYSFRVRAFNKAGGSKFSSTSVLSTAAGPPDTPAIPSTQSTSATAIKVTWKAPSENGAEVNGYVLEWMENGIFNEIYSGARTWFEVKKNVCPASYYYFRVQALSSAGASPWSPVRTCTTPPSSPAAVGPLKLVEQTSTSVALQWKIPSDNGSPIVSYNLQISGQESLFVDLKDTEQDPDRTDMLEYTIEKLRPDTSYKIRLQAVNKIGCGMFSPLITVTTRNLPPPPPIIELVNASYQSLKLKWGTALKGEGAGIKYTLQMKDKTNTFVTIFDGLSTTHKVSKLQETTWYTFRARATNDVGDGSFSREVHFQTTAQPPPPVQGLQVSSLTHDHMDIKWKSPEQKSSPAHKEAAFILQAQQSGVDKEFVTVYRGHNTSFTIDSLRSGREYRLRVCTVRKLQEQKNSEIRGPFTSVEGIVVPELQQIQAARVKKTKKEPQKEVERKPLTDQQWAMIVFIIFAALALGVAFLIPVLLAEV